MVNTGGLYLLLAGRLMGHRMERREMIKRLPREKLIRLVLSPEEFARYKVDDHELKIDGKMFDIATTRVVGDQLEVLCIRDAEEEGLLGIMRALHREPVQKSNAIPAVIGYLGLLYILEESSFEFYSTRVMWHQTTYINSFSNISLSRPSPPPRQG